MRTALLILAVTALLTPTVVRWHEQAGIYSVDGLRIGEVAPESGMPGSAPPWRAYGVYTFAEVGADGRIERVVGTGLERGGRTLWRRDGPMPGAAEGFVPCAPGPEPDTFRVWRPEEGIVVEGIVVEGWQPGKVLRVFLGTPPAMGGGIPFNDPR